MAHSTSGAGCEDVGGILNPWCAFVERLVNRSKRSVLCGCESDILPTDAVDDDCDGLLRSRLHGQQVYEEAWRAT